MAWSQVTSYSFGFLTPNKQLCLYYSLAGDGTAYQIFLTPTQFAAVSDLFRHGGVINYNSVGKYFTTTARTSP